MATEPEVLPEVLVSIPDTVAAHVLGESFAVLGKGDLTLVHTESSPISAPASPTGGKGAPILTLTVGKAAFPLYKSTTFGTLTDDLKSYVFTPEIGGERGGFVKVTLLENVLEAGSPYEKLQTKFEQILIHHGLLKEGIEAVADEIGKSWRESSINTAHHVRDSTSQYLSENTPTESPLQLHETIQSAASTGASGTEGIASAARRMSEVVSSAAGQAGAWVASHIVPTTTTATQTLDSLSNAYDTTTDGYNAGSSEVTAAMKEAAGGRIENTYGKEARSVLEDTGASAQNVGSIIGEALAATSGVTLGASGLQGAAGAQTDQQDELDAAFNDDDAWKDVSL